MTTIDAGGCAPPVHAMTDRQADQHTADRLRAENLTRTQAPITATEVRASRAAYPDTPHARAAQAHAEAVSGALLEPIVRRTREILMGPGTVGGEAPGDQL